MSREKEEDVAEAWAAKVEVRVDIQSKNPGKGVEDPVQDLNHLLSCRLICTKELRIRRVLVT